MLFSFLRLILGDGKWASSQMAPTEFGPNSCLVTLSNTGLQGRHTGRGQWHSKMPITALTLPFKPWYSYQCASTRLIAKATLFPFSTGRLVTKECLITQWHFLGGTQALGEIIPGVPTIIIAIYGYLGT